VREAYGDDAARVVRENPYRLADEVHGIGFLTADSLRLMLGIAPTSTFRLRAALKYLLAMVARSDGHVYLPLGELVDRTARQLDERRATTGRWEPAVELVDALRAYVPEFVLTDDARAEPGPAGELGADDAHHYSKALYDAECLAADRLAQMMREDRPLFASPDELELAIERAENVHEIVLEADQRRAIATALTSQVSIIAADPGKPNPPASALVDLLEQRGVAYLLLSPTAAAKRLAEPRCATRTPFTAAFQPDCQRAQLTKSRLPDLFAR
jgi:exodeoxyribonuclease V alpha subunit